MGRRKKTTELVSKGVEGQKGKSNTTATIDGSGNFVDIATTVKRRRSGEENLPVNQDSTAAVKGGRKGKKKERTCEKENDCVSNPDGTKPPDCQEDKDNGAVSRLGLGLVELNKVEKLVLPEGGELGKEFSGSTKKENGQSDFVLEKLENRIVQLEIVSSCKSGESKGAGNINLDAGKSEVEEKGEDFNFSRGNKEEGKEIQDIQLIVKDESIECSREEFGAGEGKLEVLLGQKEKKKESKKRRKNKKESKMENPGSEGLEKDNLGGKGKIMDFEAERNVKVEENVENVKTDSAEVDNAVSEELKKDNQKIDGEETGDVEEEEKDLGEEKRKGNDDAGAGGSLRKRESSRNALQKMEKMKQEWEELSEEEEVGRGKKKRGRKIKKNVGDSVVEEDRCQQARKKRRGWNSLKDEEKEDEKIYGTDGESMAGEEMEQVETEKRKGGRPPKADKDDEEDKVDGSSLSRRERYSLRTKKVETDNASKANKRCRDENGNLIESNMCHQCQRNDKGTVVRCRSCRTKRYCLHCIKRW